MPTDRRRLLHRKGTVNGDAPKDIAPLRSRSALPILLGVAAYDATQPPTSHGRRGNKRRSRVPIRDCAFTMPPHMQRKVTEDG